MKTTPIPARTRFAPSPTGRLHIGGGRTALYAYLTARQTSGQFLLRLEDTDRRRYTPGSEEDIIDGLHWLGLEWDEGFDIGGPFAPYRQTERRERYQYYARQLIHADKAYYCFCSPDRLERVRQEQQKLKVSPHYDGTCRRLDPDEAAHRVAAGEKFVIRFKAPNEGSITVVDEMRGTITVDNETIDDFILVRSDGLAVYHLSAMVDDYEMKITHVHRGSEWLPTFPLHAHIIQSLNFPMPKFYHLSLFLKPTGKGKMSKRETAELIRDGQSIFLTDLGALGFLPEAVVNWIALMGWSYDDHTEFFTMQDLIEKFSPERINPSPAAINFTKLDYYNGLHIRHLPQAELVKRIKPFFEPIFKEEGFLLDDPILEETLCQISPIIQDRIGGTDEAPQMAGFFFRKEIHPPYEILLGKNMTAIESAAAARQAFAILESMPDWTPAATESLLRALVETLGLNAGQLFGILRAAVTGQTVSPPLFESMEIIGRQKTLERLRNAIQALESM